MSSNLALRVDRVSKHFELFDSQKDKAIKLFQDYFNIHSSEKLRKYEALNNISFEIQKGEVVGVLGRNGAGKSTLLQLICGTLTPTKGYIHVEGRLAALLELGAGFNPDFSGRENIFINSAILGLSKTEIMERFDSIIEFADIGDFIDQPVKNYSSGMFMRLAFAVASSVDPDILIIDEALAVGDARFQSKCFRRLDELRKNGTTILLVSHSTEQITRHCSKALLIENGHMLAFDDAKIVANQYLELLFGKKEKKIIIDKKNISNLPEKRLENSIYYNVHEHKWGNGEAQIINFNIKQSGKINPITINEKDAIEFCFSSKFNCPVENVIFGITIKTNDGVTVFGRNTIDAPDSFILNSLKEGQVIDVTFYINAQLCTGDYLVSLGIVKMVDGEVEPMERRYDAICIRVESESTSYGIVDLYNKVDILNGKI